MRLLVNHKIIDSTLCRVIVMSVENLKSVPVNTTIEHLIEKKYSKLKVKLFGIFAFIISLSIII